MKPPTQPDFATWRAVILHRPHPVVDALKRQLELLHIEVEGVWPQMDARHASADVVFFDVDQGYDGQFPWPAGCAPMPLIALIGSEAPGRIGWGLAQSPNAHLLKPLGSTGVYSALLIAEHAYRQARGQAEDIRSLEDRLRQRPIIVSAVLHLMEDGCTSEPGAWKQLRASAMERGVTIEEAAELICRAARRSRHGA